jgi:hypothetical protein
MENDSDWPLFCNIRRIIRTQYEIMKNAGRGASGVKRGDGAQWTLVIGEKQYDEMEVRGL